MQVVKLHPQHSKHSMQGHVHLARKGNTPYYNKPCVGTRKPQTTDNLSCPPRQEGALNVVSLVAATASR
eukprot:8955032-Alexandrium_andersonii.AAC.1